MDALASWYEEKRSAYLYQALSRMEANPIHRKLFLELSELAEKQAHIWEQQLQTAQHKIPTYHPDWRARIVLLLVNYFGARSLRIALAALKIRGMSIYRCADLTPQSLTKKEIESKHTSITSGNNLRAAVFGINDGLISNVGLMLGIAGAQASHSFILLSGIAGLLAGACSMGAGEYISVRSQRDLLEYQIELEKSELELYPEEEAAELALIYEARGLPKTEAVRFANLLLQDPEHALDTLAREELGINPNEMVSPWGAAISSFFSFACGAFIPVIPFLFHASSYNLFFSIGLSAISLFSVGAILSLFTQRSAWLSGLRMLCIGTGAGILTYVIGSVFRNHLF